MSVPSPRRSRYVCSGSHRTEDITSVKYIPSLSDEIVVCTDSPYAPLDLPAVHCYPLRYLPRMNAYPCIPGQEMATQRLSIKHERDLVFLCILTNVTSKYSSTLYRVRDRTPAKRGPQYIALFHENNVPVPCIIIRNDTNMI